MEEGLAGNVGGKVRNVSEPDEGVPAYQCETCKENYDQGDLIHLRPFVKEE